MNSISHRDGQSVQVKTLISMTAIVAQEKEEVTKEDGGLVVGLWEGVRRTQFRIDDKSSINSSSKPFAVSMPP